MYTFLKKVLIYFIKRNKIVLVSKYKKHPPTAIGERHKKCHSIDDHYIMAGAIFKALGDKLGSKSKGTRLPGRLQ